MSLTREQTKETKREFKENFELAGLSLDKVARDLGTSPQIIKQTLYLNTSYIEDPWILKTYLEEKIEEAGNTPIPFSALVGDYHQYWFLNSTRIDRMIID